MKIDLASGRYVLAVSGGVDSMTLLDILAKMPGLELIVAHFNHGIRADSVKDEQLVREIAQKYGLPFEVSHGRLGKTASEETARQARYEFLDKVKKKYKVDAIITAHHQDDLIETAFLNILRGTGRKGLSSILNPKIIRPLLNIPKAEILEYAQKHHLQWREDITNIETRYLRNYIRQHLMAVLTNKQRQEILDNINKVAKLNNLIEQDIATLSHTHLTELDRQQFIMLPSDVSEELLAWWLRNNQLRDFDRKTIKRLSTAIKTAPAGSVHDVLKGRRLKLTAKAAKLT
ncbi:MAG TPA: tRNA lysidine(34) synthetase TilS [Candidatus Saccharimonadales bacterium]|nr:tRNA lysidine(34) synthetase TilS [Candidatus Saccharimonadales bacterium]